MKRLMWLFVLVVIAVSCNKTSVTLTAEEQLAYDVNRIDEYLAENDINAVKLENGIRYIMYEPGSGPPPNKDNCFRMIYKGVVLYETQAFDSALAPGYKTPLKKLITGMQVMAKMMPVGAKGTVFIPSGLAYGTTPQRTIPANSILKFDVEVTEITTYNASANYCN